ncbi:Maf family protein [Paenibacillus crassostreae]|uniref:dTTP/UTP pyrophosphatase n=1 Tax=Paenibacillus crassostreae TaxID=1763538 RepID=A0A167EEH2_9BACL|nr:Maf family protein [Paenibacillus crassostreae]AOZ91912.1 septum formation protein Maf [Paenibacillus crassostreae]OAB75457.1 septum formation protein Maf [Paenibacillus crassostreae]
MTSQTSHLIILASTSPRRQELIASLSVPFVVQPSHVDEDTPVTWGPREIVEGLALRKAEAVYQSSVRETEPSIIIGSDTIVLLDNEVLGKPINDQDALRMLLSLQGRTHQVYTGVACIDVLTGRTLVEHKVTSVTMKTLSNRTIQAYVNSGEPLDKAGSYGIQGLGATFIDKIDGCYFNVVGLPLSLLSDMLSELGMEVL